ncbi:MAG: ribonuclease III [Ilumatobacteraceae bacterium]
MSSSPGSSSRVRRRGASLGPDPAPLAERIGHAFADPALLHRAMAHRSWVAETRDAVSNERLEFLGDAVLGWVVADLVYHRFSDLPEGALTDLRKSVVNANALAEVAVELGIGTHLLLGKGEDAAGGRDKPSILSDAFEAVLGAVYVDGGPDAAYELVERFIGPRLVDAVDTLDELDHKSRLQELAARLGLDAPEYRLTSEGPDHAKRFHARAVVEGRQRGEGHGRSKKTAEQVAAAAAWRTLARQAGVDGADPVDLS